MPRPRLLRVRGKGPGGICDRAVCPGTYAPAQAVARSRMPRPRLLRVRGKGPRGNCDRADFCWSGPCPGTCTLGSEIGARVAEPGGLTENDGPRPRRCASVSSRKNSLGRCPARTRGCPQNKIHHLPRDNGSRPRTCARRVATLQEPGAGSAGAGSAVSGRRSGRGSPSRVASLGPTEALRLGQQPEELAWTLPCPHARLPPKQDPSPPSG